MSATANGADLGSLSVPSDTEGLFARVFFENVTGREGISASLSTIEATGVGIPDVNQGPPPPTVSISRVGAVDEAFTSETAEWTVSCSEAMANVTADDFAAALTGDAAADAPTIAGGPSEFTVTAANVTGEVGTIRLNLNDGTDIETVADATPIDGEVGPAYSKCSKAATDPFHCYLTWQNDTSTTITVNYHTRSDAGQSLVRFDIVSRGGVPDDYMFQASGNSHQVPGLEAVEGVARTIHVVELTDLLTGQEYYFIAGDPVTGFTDERKFRTIPDGGEPIRFVTGGDMGADPVVR